MHLLLPHSKNSVMPPSALLYDVLSRQASCQRKDLLSQLAAVVWSAGCCALLLCADSCQQSFVLTAYLQ